MTLSDTAIDIFLRDSNGRSRFEQSKRFEIGIKTKVLENELNSISQNLFELMLFNLLS